VTAALATASRLGAPGGRGASYHDSKPPLALSVELGEATLTRIGVDEAVRRAYVLCTRDRAIPPALQRRMIAENPCVDVVELDTDHSPMLSATGDLAAALTRFASGS